jgi:hypothetical protein
MQPEIDVFFGEGDTFTRSGLEESAVIRQIKVGQMSRFQKTITPVIAEMRLKLGAVPELKAADLLQVDLGLLIALADVCVPSKTWKQPYDEWDLDEFIALLLKIFEVNAHFFTKRLAPLITAGVARVKDLGLTQ